MTPLVHPIYKVEGTLLISQTKEPTLNGKDREAIQGDVGVFQRTLVTRILDRDVLAAALEKLPDEKRPNFLVGLGTSDRAIYTLMGRLVAKEVDRTYLIRVSISGDESQGLAITLYEVLSSLIDKLREEQEKQYSSRLSYLRSEQQKIAARVAEEKSKILSLASGYDNRSFLRSNFSSDLGKLDLIQKLYWESQSLTLTKGAELEEAEKDKEELPKVSLSAFAEERVADNFGINQIENWTYEKSQDLRATIDGLVPSNPDRQYTESRMTSMNEYLANYKKRVSEETFANLNQKRDFELETATIKARNAHAAAQRVSQQLDRELSAANEEARNISEAIFESNELTFGLTQLRERLASINSRIDDVELEAKAPLPVSMDLVPTPPLKPASSNASKLMAAAFVLSFGLVGGLCLLFDFADGRIRSREELGAAVGGAGAEPIPALVPKGEDPAFARILLDHARHPASIALRDLALRLTLEHQRCGAKIFAFVGSDARVGNTSIALNTARAISSHGYKVLLAELPTQSPGLAAAAGLLPTPPPPSPWGNKAQDPQSAVEILPWVNGMAEDRVRSSVDSFLSNATKAFDVILLDLVSFSDSDIACEAALKADAVIVTARQNLSLFQDVRRIVEYVGAGGVPAVTTVLNFSQPEEMRVRAIASLGVVQVSVSRFHELFRERVALAAGEGTARLRAWAASENFVKKSVAGWRDRSAKRKRAKEEATSTAEEKRDPEDPQPDETTGKK